MAQGLTFTISADDQTGPPVKQASSNLSAAFATIQQQLAKLEAVSGQGSAAIVQGLDHITQATKATARATQVMAQDVGAAMRTVKTSADQAHVSTRTLTTGLGALATRLAAGFGLVELGRSFLSNALAMDSARQALQGVTGSVGAAAKELTSLDALAEKAGVGIATLSQQWAGLYAAVNQVPGRLETTREVFDALVTTGARLGKSTDQIGNALYGLTQLAGGATVQLDELARQIGDQLPGLLPALAREMGLTGQEMRKMASEGKLLVDDVLRAMPNAIKSLVSGEGGVTTARGEFERMGLAWTKLMDTVATSGALGVATGLVQALTWTVKQLAVGVKDLQALMGGGEAETKQQRRVEVIREEMTRVNQALTILERQPSSAARDAQMEKFSRQLNTLNDEAVGLGKALDAALTPAPSGKKTPAEATLEAQIKLITELDKTPASIKRAIAAIDQQFAALKSGDVTLLKAYGLDPTDPQFQQQLKAYSDTLTNERTKLQNQLLGIDTKGAATAAKSAQKDAAQRAREDQQALEESLKQQVSLVAASYDDRRQVIDQKFSEDLAREPLRVKELSAIRAAELQTLAVEEARFVEQVQLDSLTRQNLTAEEFAKKKAEITKRTGEVELKISQQTLQQQITDAEDLVSVTEKVNEQIRDRDEKMQEERRRELQSELDQQARAYQSFSDRIVGYVADAFQGLLEGTLNAVDFFKKLLIQQLSSIASNVIGPLIARITATAVGGIASVLPTSLGAAVLKSAGLPGAGDTGGAGTGSTGSALQGLGFLASLKTIGSGFMQALGDLTGTLVSAGSTISTTFGGPAILTASQVGQASTVGAGTAGATVIPSGVVSGVTGGVGGAAALGIGIYKALNAVTIAEKAAWSASAAAGAAALASTALVAAGVIAASSGWTGIGLIAAAVTAVIGTVLPMLVKPAGPSLSVRAGGGLGIGVQGGQLAVQGDLASRVTRREGVDRSVAQGVQTQLEAGITAAVMSIVQTINAVALDPAALVGPTQEALQKALRTLQPINTANAKKMEADLKEQLRFANIAIVGGLLEPLNLAFDQLRDHAEVKQQLERLPGTVGGLVDIFKTMNTQLDEIAKSENTDVLRQLSAVRNQVENFGNRIAGTAGQIAEGIVNTIVERFEAQVDTDLAASITQFAGLMNDSFAALAGLRTTRQTLEGAGLPGGMVGSQIDRLAEAMGRAAASISSQIVTTALQGLSADLQHVLVQPLTIQATTVTGLFHEALASLNALGAQWQRFSAEGLATGAIEQQFNRLVGGMLNTLQQVLDTAFTTGSFADFLTVAAAIPQAVTALNPVWQALQQTAAVFQQVVGPNAQRIMVLEDAMRTTGERARVTARHIEDLQRAIADAGDSADQALPLYDQLSQAIVASAEMQIAAIRAIAQAWEQALGQVRGDIDAFEDSLGSLSTQLDRAVSTMIVSAHDFNMAAASGDTLAAIQAVQVYEQSIVALADLEIRQVQQHRDLTIAAQQAVIDGVQGQIDAQQGVIDGTQALIDAQQSAIDGIHDQMDVQQAVIDQIGEHIDAYQDVIDITQDAISTVQEAIRAQEQYIQGLEREVDARQQALDSLTREIETLRRISDRVGDITRGGLSPARQAPAIREAMTATWNRLMTSGGDEAIQELEKLIALNEELMQLGEQTDQLILVKEALDNLGNLQTQLNAHLGAKEAEVPMAQQQLDAARAAVDTATQSLTAHQAQLATLQDQLKVQQDWLEAMQDQQQGQQDVLKAIEAQLKPAEAQLSALNAQLEVDRAQLDALQAQQQAQQDVLAEIERSRYWDGRIAEIQTIALQELHKIERWLSGVQGNTLWEDQIRAYQFDAMVRLQSIEGYLRALWQLSAQPRQQGGLVGLASGLHYAQGGMVPVRLEPGERVYSGVTAAQMGALASMNAAWPRFATGGWTVPGAGSGDTFQAWVPSGSFVLNRRAAGTQGRQDGGTVQSGNGGGKMEVHHHHHYNISGNTFSDHEDLKRLTRQLEELRRKWGNTRL